MLNVKLLVPLMIYLVLILEPKKPRYESPIEEENPGVVVSEPQRQERPWSGEGRH